MLLTGQAGGVGAVSDGQRGAPSMRRQGSLTHGRLKVPPVLSVLPLPGHGRVAPSLATAAEPLCANGRLNRARQARGKAIALAET